MIRSSLLAAASLLVLTACQPAPDSTEALVAETPPQVEETVETTAISADENGAEIVETAATTENEGTDEHDHGEDHVEDNDDHEDHEDHDHADDHDGHDGDHDHAGGEAHVHGLSDLAVSLDGASVSISMEGALANFDIDETLRELDEASLYTDGIVELIGGDCTRDQADASIRPIGDHGNLMIDLAYTCASVEAVEAVNVTAFARFEGFEEVNAVVLTDTGQTATTLTESVTRLDLE
ncbi:MAG: DUF2796 domain-containing protein [Pseudomonadota bacterium]